MNDALTYLFFLWSHGGGGGGGSGGSSATHTHTQGTVRTQIFGVENYPVKIKNNFSEP